MADSSSGKSSVEQWQNAAQSVARPKMDMAKALAILGFSSSRTLDANGGHDPKVELSNALSRSMVNLEKRKAKAEAMAAKNPGKAIKNVCMPNIDRNGFNDAGFFFIAEGE